VQITVLMDSTIQLVSSLVSPAMSIVLLVATTIEAAALHVESQIVDCRYLGILTTDVT
jgi:hypothetical protein